MSWEFMSWESSRAGLVTGIQSLITPTGANASDSRPITPNVGQTIVGETKEKSSSIFDVIGKGLGAVFDNELVQRYVDGKITKELMNDGVPLYTTYGNPSDQAGGKLLQDMALQEEKATRTYLLVGVGVVGLLIVAVIIAKRS